MASRIVLKQLRSNVLRSSFRPAVATGVFDRFSFTRKMHHDHKSVSLNTVTTVPRSFKRDDAQNIFLFIDMPGISMNDVDVTVNNRYSSYFLVEGEVMKDYECESRKYRSRFDLPENINTSRIKANMKDGVLKVTLPKTKETEQEEDEEEEEDTMREFKIMVN